MCVSAIRLLFASNFLFNCQVGGHFIAAPIPLTSISTTPSTNLLQTKSCAVISNKRSSFAAYQSRFYPVPQNVDYGADGHKKALTAAVVKRTIRSPFSILKWQGIASLATDLMNVQDAVDEASVAVRNVYTCTVDLLCLKMQNWLNERDPKTIAKYLEFGPETLDLVNAAITELSRERRKKTVRIDNLLHLFYYACDVDDMHSNEVNKTRAVGQNFKYFLRKFRWRNSASNEGDLIGDLEKNLRLMIVGETDDSFAVTVPAMKLRIVAEPSGSGALSAIQNRKAVSSSRNAVVDLVRSYAKEKDGTKINEYHLSVLGVLVTHVFGYAFNHFGLLSKLRAFGVGEAEKSVIEEFSAFMDGYVSIFVDRFFELKGEIGQDLLDAMFVIKRFLNPSDRRDDAANETADPAGGPENRDGSSQDRSIRDYYDESGRNAELDDHMETIMNAAVDRLFATFIENSDEDREFELENWPKIDYGDRVHDRASLLSLMKANNASAMEILSTFSCEFTLGTEIYDKYKSNDGSEALLDSALVLTINQFKT